MPKFKISSKIKRPNFNPTGIRQFSRSQARDKIADWLHSALTDNLMFVFFLLWLLPLLVVIIFATINFSSLPDQIPLFYSRKWGEAKLAPKSYIFVPALGTLFLGIFNFCLSINFHSKERVLSYLLSGTAGIVALLVAITSIKIVLLMV